MSYSYQVESAVCVNDTEVIDKDTHMNNLVLCAVTILVSSLHTSQVT